VEGGTIGKEQEGMKKNEKEKMKKDSSHNDVMKFKKNKKEQKKNLCLCLQ